MYPPHHLGGYELVWHSAIKWARDQGHEARVLTTDFRLPDVPPDESGTFRELRWYWEDHDWPRVGWWERIRLERHNHAVLKRHLEDLQPDVVSWWAMGGMSLALIEQVRRAGIRSVGFVHDEWLVYAPEVDRWTRAFRNRPVAGAIARALTGVPAHADIDSSTRCLLVSETVRAHARQAGYRLADSEILRSGIDTDLFRPHPEADWRWRLLYVGRIDARKGITDATAALADLPEVATLAIVGTGDGRTTDELAARARQLGVEDRITWVGMAPREALPDIYASADALLFPVRWDEPWGLVPLEAMATGRPVIATGRGGSGEYLRDESNCLLVPVAQPAAVASAVSRLAADPELRGRLRRGGLQTAREFTETGFNQRALAALIAAGGGRRDGRSGDVAA